MKILLVEPFFSGSHQSWAEAFQRSSRHEVRLLTLPGRHWKWRMIGGAVSLARKFLAADFIPDLILTTDMLDVSTFLALSRSRSKVIPVAVYFHENQITYPWSPTDADIKLERNHHYGFINYTSALTADAVFFNSRYHLDSFCHALQGFLHQFPDHREKSNIAAIQNKSSVLPLGLDLQRFDLHQKKHLNGPPVILWNHRWEYDKNSALFFQTLFRLADEKIDFRLVVLGAAYRQIPPEFAEAQEKLKEKILHFGFADSFADYATWLWQADILPVTSNQDFFGGSVVEAIYCGCIPLLPQRLAYPEHIPEHLQKDYFYATDDDFYLRLRSLLSDDRKNNSVVELQNFVSKYDWSTLVTEYDQALENMIA